MSWMKLAGTGYFWSKAGKMNTTNDFSVFELF